MNTKTRMLTISALTALFVAVPSLVADDRELDSRESYSYVRVLDGRATLASQGSAPGEEASVNQPLMTGDRVSVAHGARVEIALADRNLVRVGGGTVLTLTRIAFSGDRGERSTLLDLEDGEVLLTVTEDALGDSLPELRTPTAEVVIHRPGTYRVSTAPEGWTEVVVREGFAEVVTGGGSTLVRENESAYASYSGRDVDIAGAGALSSLERWGEELTSGARQAVLHVDPELSYHAAPLAGYGSWVNVDSVNYWQPRVEVGWRPYWRGRWGWTPSGMTWISSEPWGWVPYHYGTWCSLPRYGWVWRPGRIYSPAWVYWHWSDDWVGWIPAGYYTNWYDSWGFDFGFRFGVYGWSSGGWGYYNDWNFAPNYCLRRRDQGRYMRRGGDLARELGPRVPRGVLTTDTRGLPRDQFADRGFASGEFARRARERRGDDLTDVTEFVARRRDLPPQVRDVVRADGDARVRLVDEPGANGDGRRSGDRGRHLPATDDPAGARSNRDGRNEGDGRVFDRPAGGSDDRGSVRSVPDANPRMLPGDRRGRNDGDGVVTRPRTLPGGGSDNDRSQVAPRSRPPVRDDGNGVVTRPRTLPGGGSDNDRSQVAPRSRPPVGDDGNGVRAVPGANPRLPPATGTRPGGSGDAGGGRGVLRPGGSVEIDSRGRVRPYGGSEATPPRTDSGPRPSERQGWRAREGSSGSSSDSPSRVEPRSGSVPQTRRDEPVQRVLGGIRSGGASGSERGWQAPNDRAVPGYSRPAPRPSTNPGARSDAPSYVRPAPRSTPPATYRAPSARPSPSQRGSDAPSYLRPAPRSAPPATYRAPSARPSQRGSDSSVSPQRPSSGSSSSRSGSSTSSSSRSSSGSSKSSNSGSRGSSRGPSSPPRRSGGG